MVDVLNLEFLEYDRDMHIMTPVLLSLERGHGLKVRMASLRLAWWFVAVCRPRLILISNAHGDESTVHFIKDLKSLGFPVVTLITEGNIQEAVVDSYVWGWNTDRILYQDAFILWTERSRHLAAKHFPELRTKLEVSGATGFDRYFLLPREDVETCRRRHGIAHYKRVVGIASFGIFDFVDRPEVIRVVCPAWEGATMDLFRIDLQKLREIYARLVRENPDTLFVLRVHPQLAKFLHKTEFTGCFGLPNVLVSSVHHALPQITDAIGVSDFWIGYESSTSMEAWLMGKMVVYVNPTTVDFQRENHYRGCLIVQTAEELDAVAKRFYAGAAFPEYEALAAERDKVVEEVVGYTDGKSHQRAADIIARHVKAARTRWSWRLQREVCRRINVREVLKYFLHKSDLYFRLRPRLNRPAHSTFLDQPRINKYRRTYEQHISG